MKKLCLLIAVISILSILPAKAQFEKGRFMVSVTSTIGLGDYGSDLMNIGYTTRKIKDSGGDINATHTAIGFNLLPAGGYFLIDNLAVGADIMVSYNLQKSKD